MGIRRVLCTRVQSMPSNSAANSTAVSRTAPSTTGGQRNAPPSSCFQTSTRPLPVNRRHRGTSPNSSISMGYRADRRRTPPPIHTPRPSGRSNWPTRTGSTSEAAPRWRCCHSNIAGPTFLLLPWRLLPYGTRGSSPLPWARAAPPERPRRGIQNARLTTTDSSLAQRPVSIREPWQAIIFYPGHTHINH